MKNVSQIIYDIKLYLKDRVEKFEAGSLRSYIRKWGTITPDPEILSYVSGIQVEFIGIPHSGSVFTEAIFNLTQISRLMNNLN